VALRELRAGRSEVTQPVQKVAHGNPVSVGERSRTLKDVNVNT
jgi:hypothetical protein